MGLVSAVGGDTLPFDRNVCPSASSCRPAPYTRLLEYSVYKIDPRIEWKSIDVYSITAVTEQRQPSSRDQAIELSFN